ncbi:hypothetical protein ACWD0J_38875 [Streptomyces sp. NPDC003011]
MNMKVSLTVDAEPAFPRLIGQARAETFRTLEPAAALREGHAVVGAARERAAEAYPDAGTMRAAGARAVLASLGADGQLLVDDVASLPAERVARTMSAVVQRFVAQQPLLVPVPAPVPAPVPGSVLQNGPQASMSRSVPPPDPDVDHSSVNVTETRSH